MKLLYTKTILVFALLLSAFSSKAQETNDLLNLLLKKKVITPHEADSIKASYDLKQKKLADENQHGIALGRALQISGLVQARYQGFEQSSVPNSFDLHRARLDIKGDVTPQWSYEVYTEFAGAVKLLDAYTSYKIADYLKFTAGQFKVPFSYESLTSDSQLEFIDRSQVVEALVSRSKDVIGNNIGRDIGAQVSGSFVKVNGSYLFDYTFGVFNGAGYDVTADNNNHKDIDGRLGIHPVNGLSLGADFYRGVGYYGSPAKNQTRNRSGIDARYVLGPLSLTAEYNKGTDGTIKRDGWYAQAGYFILPRHLQVVGKVDTYDPNKSIATDRSTYYISGLNYYFNEWARLAVNYSYRREEVSQLKNNVIETQLQITF